MTFAVHPLLGSMVSNPMPVPKITLHEWLSAAPFSMGMSSGFFGFFAHTGVLLALEERKLLPRFIGGSSAGALVAGMWASGVNASEIASTLRGLDRASFWDPAPGLGILRGKLFRTKLESLLGAKSIETCRVPLAISVFDVRRRKTVVLREGDLASAIHASCALPLLFQPVRREGVLLSDGGIADRPGLQGFADEGRTFYHHLSSKSPWRRLASPALRVPNRPNWVSLKIAELPRANPFRLQAGRAAITKAYDAAQRALDAPLAGNVVAV